MLKAIEWKKEGVKILDQLALPHKTQYELCKTYKATGAAIKSMKLRGAPAIGVAAAFGMAQAALASKAKDFEGFKKDLDTAAEYLKSQRPTAVNLAWGVDRMLHAFYINRTWPVTKLKVVLHKEAQAIEKEDIAMCQAMGDFGAELIRDGDQVLTHCNTGALATAGIGTALGCVTTAHKQGKKISVWVDETRPYLQGARLTAYELKVAGIDHKLITDSTAALLMARKQVSLVIVGADRITAQGDVANKIGTYGLAILAKEHKVPFYVVAPTSTIDLATETGDQIPIEERSSEEVTMVQGKLIAPKGTQAAHFAFDVTPYRYISAIVTEQGLCRSPFPQSLKAAVEKSLIKK